MAEGKKYLVFGVGMQGLAIAHDLLRSPGTERVTVVDRDDARVEAAVRRLDDPRVTGATADATDLPFVTALMYGHDCVIAAASYELNLGLTRAAIAAGCHYCDLGGNNDVVAAQFLLADDAVSRGLRVLPDCGIAPGAVSVLAKHAMSRVPDAERVLIRVGGLPQTPRGPLKYGIVFSARGLVSNYCEPTEILWEGKREMVPSLGGREYQNFPSLARLEAAYTSGGSSTLTQTYEGRIKYLDYKTLRWEGHWDVVTMMRDLGLFATDRAIDVDGLSLTPRDFTERLLDETLPKGEPDMLVLRVAALNRDRQGVVFDLIDRSDPVTGHSAMQRTTGYSASICAQMLVSGEITPSGVLKHEDVVPAQRFIEEWAKRGINLTEAPSVP
jgi:lysine 6-dehydrogenase